MKSALVVLWGAGPAGQEIGKEFLRRGIAVRFVTRSGTAVPVAGAEIRKADVLEEKDVLAACDGATIVVNAVGAPYQDWARVLPLAQRNLMKAAASQDALLLSFENLYSYALDQMPLSESTAEIPSTKKGALRLDLSKLWIEAHKAGKIKAVSVRASDYFGPTAIQSANSQFGTRFFPSLMAGKTTAFLGNPDLQHSMTYLPDLARAVVDVSQAPESWGRPWIAPTIREVSMAQLTRGFAEKAGRPPRVGRLPSWAVKLLGLTNPLIREVVEMLDEFRRPFIVDSGEFEKKFGWKATPLQTAIDETWKAVKASI